MNWIKKILSPLSCDPRIQEMLDYKPRSEEDIQFHKQNIKEGRDFINKNINNEKIVNGVITVKCNNINNDIH